MTPAHTYQLVYSCQFCLQWSVWSDSICELLTCQGWDWEFLFIYLFFFFLAAGCGMQDLSFLRLGIVPAPPAVEAPSLNHWTAREVRDLRVFRHWSGYGERERPGVWDSSTSSCVAPVPSYLWTRSFSIYRIMTWVPHAPGGWCLPASQSGVSRDSVTRC